MKTALWWLRRDLRLGDNQALAAALSQSEQVLPVFVLDPALLNSPYVGEKRLAFLYEGLRALDSDLHQRGSYLVVRSGDPLHVLADLCRLLDAQAIFAEADYSPYARRRDQRAAKVLPLHFTPGLTVHSPEAILKPDGTPYRVFTPFSKAWQARPWPGEPLPAPPQIPTPSGFDSDMIHVGERSPATDLFPAGEIEAQRRLDNFIFSQDAPIFAYRENRNRLDLEGTSSLSPYLRVWDAFRPTGSRCCPAGGCPSLGSTFPPRG